jgi:tRNA U34 5-methylaminomethyl-2-thiouridine-forming methyltransferase MnmC
MVNPQRIPLLTKDGSHTMIIPELDLTFHSRYGAIRESKHVFIEAGLRPLLEKPVENLAVFEMGFGTGLNALLTLMEAEKHRRTIHYTTLELYPLETSEALSLNYCKQLGTMDFLPSYTLLHDCAWESKITVSPYFYFQKIKADLREFNSPALFELVYYDAFAPAAQPALWTPEIFKTIYRWLQPAGILVTYSSKGVVRRSLQSAGFVVEKLPGPPGKREITRAKKPG